MTDQALAGLRVVELADFVAGAFCGKLLADFGADVIKVEPPGGCSLRAAFPVVRGDPERAGYFLALNTNKRSVTADIEHADGVAVVKRLLLTADVVILESEGDMDTVGWVRGSLKPGAVLASITPFGLSGPRTADLGGDLVASAAGGLAFITGEPDHPPLKAGAYQALHLAGLQAAASTLIAVFAARRRGVGQVVEVSMQEAVIAVLEATVPDFFLDGTVRSRMGTKHPTVHGLGMQQLRDGAWLFVGTLPTDAMWDGARAFMPDAEWMADPRWRDPRTRRLHADEIDRLAAETFSKLNSHDAYEALQSRRIPVAIVNNVPGLLASAQLASRRFFREIAHPIAGNLTYPGPICQLSVTPAAEPRSAPTLGEHNQEIYMYELGLSAEEFAAACT